MKPKPTPPKEEKPKGKTGTAQAYLAKQAARATRDQQRKELREKALHFYISCVGKPNVSQMEEMDPWAVLAKGTLANWSGLDEWPKRREEFQRAVFRQFVDKSSGRIAQMYMDMLEKIDPIQLKIEAALMTMDFETEEPAKMLAQYVKILETKSKFTTEAVRLITPAPEGAVQPQGVVDSGASSDVKEAAGQDNSVSAIEARQAALKYLQTMRKNATANTITVPAPAKLVG